MAYSEELAERLRHLLLRDPRVSEKRMFGGLSFLVDGKMFCGILGNDLMVRVDPSDSEALLGGPHVRPMDFTGRPMKGFLYVDPGGYGSDEALAGWTNRALDYVASLPRQRRRRKA
jgi:TfoX/Sxy family transcriptional regulator of competence genes